MLLKIGVWSMAAALAIAVGVALVLVLRPPDRPAEAELVAIEETTATLDVPDSYGQFERPAPERRPEPKRETEPTPEPTPPPELAREPVPQPGQPRDPLTGEASLPMPKEAELARLNQPRTFAPDPNAGLTLTIPSLGLRNAPVYDSDSKQALAAGIAHVPETSMPWDRGAQRNVYLAAHRLGYPGSGSRLIFYELDQLGRGDEVVLKGRGNTYRYRVSEVLIADWNDSKYMGQMVGRDMVTLQTCTPIPTFEKRLIVRADRV